MTYCHGLTNGRLIFSAAATLGGLLGQRFGEARRVGIARNLTRIAIEQRRERVDRGIGDELSPQMRTDIVHDRRAQPAAVRSSVTVRAVAGDAVVEPMIVLPSSELRTWPGPTVCDDSVVIPRITGTAPPSAVLIASSLPTPFCSETIGADGIELAGEGAQGAQRVDRLDEEKEHLRPVEIARSSSRPLPVRARLVVDAQAVAFYDSGDAGVVVEHRHVAALRQVEAEERPHRAGADDADPRALRTLSHAVIKLILKPMVLRRDACVTSRWPKNSSRARRDVNVAVQIDHRIGEIVDARLEAEAVQRRVLPSTPICE